MHPQPRAEPGRVVDRLHDVRGLGAAFVPDRVRHGDPSDVAEVRQEVRNVEDRRDGLAPTGLADEREVRDGDREALAGRSQPAKLGQARSVPAGAVNYEPIGHLEQVVDLLAAERRLVRPPDRHWEIVDEQRSHDRVEMAASLSAARQVDRVEVTVVPVLLGGGTPLLGAGSGIANLGLIRTHTYPSGMVSLQYEVTDSAQ